MKRTAKLISFGLGGHHVDYGKCSDNHWWADPPDKMSTHWSADEIPEEGVPVIDKTQAVGAPDGLRMALSGPMCDVDLKPGEVDACPAASPVMEQALGGEFRYMALAQRVARIQGRRYGPLDSVDLKTYLGLWRAAGARIGRFYVRDGKGVIEWEEKNHG